jgi:hypothetical protein
MGFFKPTRDIVVEPLPMFIPFMFMFMVAEVEL